MSITVHYHENWAAIELNRPNRANSYTQSILNTLLDAINVIESKDKRGILIRSQGDSAFCSGADLDEMATAQPESAKKFIITTCI